MRSASTTRHAHSIRRGKAASSKLACYCYLLSCQLFTSLSFQAFSSVLNLAGSGTAVNTTADDVRAMVTLAYLSLNPDFPALNLALYGALNGNWTGLSYAAFAPTYTAELFRVLPTLCLDQRKASSDMLLPHISHSRPHMRR